MLQLVSNGTDTLDFSLFGTPVTLDLSNSSQQDAGGGLLLTLSGFFDIVYGSIFDDHITGNSLDNTVSGGAGNDTLEGGAGADALNGDAAMTFWTAAQVQIRSMVERIRILFRIILRVTHT